MIGNVKILYPSFADSNRWRTNCPDRTANEMWRRIRQQILKRDDYTCQYCNFRAMHWQIVHHIDGNPNNNDKGNLETICPMCNLIMHAGQGCIIQEVVYLYRESRFNQGRINQITREMRGKGSGDTNIIAFLGLGKTASFRMDRKYLSGLFGFVSSRKPEQEWTRNALEYGYRMSRITRQLLEHENRKLNEFI